MEIKDLKIAITALEKAGRYGSLHGKLVTELIEIYEDEGNTKAAEFWNDRAFNIF